MPVIEPWRQERQAMGTFWICMVSVPIMLCACLQFLWMKAGDAWNEFRLPDLKSGAYPLVPYPPDPYIRPDNTAVDAYMITFTDVVVTDEAVQIKAVATNITVKKQEMDCSRTQTNHAIEQWTVPVVVFPSGSEPIIGGTAWCEGAKAKVTVRRGGKLKVVAEFAREKRFSRDFTVRWGQCLHTDHEGSCARYTTEHRIDLTTDVRAHG